MTWTKSHWIGRLAAIALLVFCAATMTAQSGGLQGTVVDPKGGLIAGANIIARSDSTGKSITATADAQGHFTLSGLPAGSYSVLASANGFKVATTRGVQVGSDTGAPLTLKLDVQDATDQVSVDANETHSIAAKLAPMDALLDETSARTEITSTMINNYMSPISDYGEAVEMAPGTFTTNGNGVGLGQSKTNFRGFPTTTSSSTAFPGPTPTACRTTRGPSSHRSFLAASTSTVPRALLRRSGTPRSAAPSISSPSHFLRSRISVAASLTARSTPSCSTSSTTRVRLARARS
jgi:hypothetical protein